MIESLRYKFDGTLNIIVADAGVGKLRKHFALFGGTGTGKSSGLVVILRAVLAAKPNHRIFLIDPHED